MCVITQTHIKKILFSKRQGHLGQVHASITIISLLQRDEKGGENETKKEERGVKEIRNMTLTAEIIKLALKFQIS